ncbi:hypothetical protein Pst134EB_030046 [Puccinia striiformis f. sp. tritici]|nr:hypothetical protein Pst134EB_030046 [Puccinia striiformis f. sp. tritici]
MSSSDSLKKQYEELMKVVTEEQTLRQQAEQDKQRLEGELAAALQAATAKPATPKPAKLPKLALSDKFDGTRGNKAENFANQISLHFWGNPEAFCDNHSKLIFTLTHLTGQASSWAQPFTQMLTNKEDVTIDQFWTSFSGMYFDGEKRPTAEKALRAVVSHIKPFLSFKLHTPGPAQIIKPSKTSAQGAQTAKSRINMWDKVTPQESQGIRNPLLSSHASSLFPIQTPSYPCFPLSHSFTLMHQLWD